MALIYEGGQAILTEKFSFLSRGAYGIPSDLPYVYFCASSCGQFCILLWFVRKEHGFQLARIQLTTIQGDAAVHIQSVKITYLYQNLTIMLQIGNSPCFVEQNGNLTSI